MTRLIGFSVLGLTLFTLSNNSALAQKKGATNKQVDASPATAQQYGLLGKYTEMVGTIQSATTNTAGTTIVLRVEYDHPDPNANNNNNNNNKTNTRPNTNANQAANRMAQNHAREAQRIQQQLQKLQRDQAALQNSKTPQQAQQKLQQIARDQQQLQRELYQYQVQETQMQQRQMMTGMKGTGQNPNPKMKKDYIDFELPLVEKAQVRRLSTGVEYDDKGNVKEPEKGTSNLPGVAAKLEDLASGGKAKVYLSPAKPAPAKAAAKKDGDDAPVEALPANRPQVRVVVMLSEPGGLPGAGNPKKKAK